MTGQEIQDRVDALVTDLQTKGKGQTVNVLFRNDANVPTVLPLSSSAQGVVVQAELDAINNFLSDVIPVADSYSTASVPVAAANEAFKLASQPHEQLRIAAQNANAALRDALAADANYQAAKTALDNARADADYVSAVSAYDSWNVAENYAALQQAKGEYVA